MLLRRLAPAGLAALACACDSGMLVGSDLTGDASSADATSDDVAVAPVDAGTLDTSVTPVGDGSPIIFTTSFESDNTGIVSDFGPSGCYLYAGAINSVTSLLPGPAGVPPGPAHTGNYAAAFSITTAAGAAWARCFLNNGLPQAAYYSAWFNILWNTTDSTGWNVMHWQRGQSDGGAVYLWDVLLANEPNGTLSPAVMDYTRNSRVDATQITIVAGTWYHFEVYLQRSDTDAGAFTLFVNDLPALQLTGVSTDTTPMFGFHIGSYAQSLTSQSASPTGDPVYVDDIFVSTQYVQNDGGFAP